MFKINMLPATFGDSFWVTYTAAGKEHRILIDGGTAGTRNHIHKLIRALPDGDKRIDLVVVSHIDNDHIAGILTMLQRKEVTVDIGDFWFNGRDHLPEDDDDLLGSKQAVQLETELKAQGINWNKAFAGKSVMIPDTGDLPVVNLPGGMKLTLISPTKQALTDLAPVWDRELREAGLLTTDPLKMDQDESEPSDDDDDDFLSTTLPDVDALANSSFTGDSSAANGSSIAFILEFEGKKVIFAADAHVPQMLDAFKRLSPGVKLEADLFKISHHGSKGTTSKELIEKVNCKRYAITTNGSNFDHPDQETIARILVAAGDGCELLFNYKSADNEIWNHATLKDNHNYAATYPTDNKGLVVDV